MELTLIKHGIIRLWLFTVCFVWFKKSPLTDILSFVSDSRDTLFFLSDNKLAALQA
jgi:hypothetical protein